MWLYLYFNEKLIGLVLGFVVLFLPTLTNGLYGLWYFDVVPEHWQGNLLLSWILIPFLINVLCFVAYKLLLLYTQKRENKAEQLKQRNLLFSFARFSLGFMGSVVLYFLIGVIGISRGGF